MKYNREKNPGKCENCGKKKKDLCDDGWCKKCHKTCSWKDCISGAWNARIRKAFGIGGANINGFPI